MSHWNETHRVPATVTLSEGTTIEGEIHLQPYTEWHPGRELPIDLMNRPERFLAVSLPSGDTALVSKAQIAVVTAAASASEVDPQRRAISRRFDLEVHMIGGQKITGSTYWELPPTHGRPQDLLNASEAFFEISEGENIHLLNRVLVGYVKPAE